MKIINGVRFANVNEPARRFAARVNALYISGYGIASSAPQQSRLPQLITRCSTATCIRTPRGGSAAADRALSAPNAARKVGKVNFDFTSGRRRDFRRRTKLRVTDNCYYIFRTDGVYRERSREDSTRSDLSQERAETAERRKRSRDLHLIIREAQVAPSKPAELSRPVKRPQEQLEKDERTLGSR